MGDRHHRIKGGMVTTMERPERTAEEWSLLIRTAVDFGLYFFSKMDEVHIISYMYMDEVGIPMLVTMSQYKKWGLRLKQWESINTYIQLVVHNGGVNGRMNTNIDLKNWYIGTMEFS